ncbi:MAG: TonB-dependent receptor [Prolixibacteraceae bacterium]|nr:TonB-dependent receptor [Prolixibacteraceae bacterium]
MKAQEKVTITVSEQPLNTVLNKLSENGKIRFAFDNDYFKGIKVTFSVTDMEIEKFLGFMAREYPMAYKYIGGTWVLFRAEKPVTVLPKPVATVKKEPELVIKKKEVPAYIQPRIYYFQGRVVDANSGDALKYCSVAIPGGKSVITDESGVFYSEIVSTGRVGIKVGHLGYLPLDTVVDIVGKQNIQLTLQPVSLINYFEANTRNVKFQLGFHEKPEFIAFNGNASAIIPSLFPNDMVNLYAAYPGVMYQGMSPQGMQVRGGNQSEVVSYIGQIPLFEPNFLFGNQSLLNSAILQQSYFSRGGYGLEYSGGIAGTVQNEIKTGQNTRPVVELDANLLDASLLTMLPLGEKVSISAFFRKSLIEYWPNFLFKNLSENVGLASYSENPVINGSIEKPEASYLDFNLKLSIKPSANHEIAITAIGNQNAESRSFAWTLPDSFNETKNNTVLQYGGSLNWSALFNPNWSSSVNVSYYSLDKKGSSVFSSGETVINNVVDENSLSGLNIRWQSVIEQNIITHYFGTAYHWSHFNYNFFENDFSAWKSMNVLPFGISTINHVADIYYQGRLNILPWLRIKAGAKARYNFTVHDFQVLPNGSVEFLPADGVRIYYLTGRYLQELYRSTRFDTGLNRTTVWILPDNGTFFSKSYQNIAGLNYDRGGFLLNIEAYAKTVDDRPLLFARSNYTNDVENVSYQIQKGTSTSIGVDFFAQYRHSVFSHSLAYSLGRNSEAVNSVNSGNSFWSLTDRLHVVKISELVSYKGWMASLNWNFATGIPYFTLSSTTSEFFQGRSSAYSRLDISIMKQFKVKSARIQLGLSVLNLLDNRNVNNIEFSTLRTANSSFDVQKTFYDLPFSPQAFVSVRFE